MALLSCSTSPSTSDVDLDINDYFDFDAASCDSDLEGTSWEYVDVDSEPSSKALDRFDLNRLVIDRDTYQIKDEVAGIYPAAFDDATLGLPSTTQFDFWESPEAYDSSDSESWCSTPGSPFSFSSALSPPHSPINYGSDVEHDTEFLSNADVTESPPSPPPHIDIQLEPSTSSVLPQSREASPALFDSVAPLSTIVHAPRPISPRRDVVGSLETIVQSPSEETEPGTLWYFQNESDDAQCLPSDSPLTRPELQIIHLDDFPERSPSCDSDGPVHRVGKSERRKRKRVSCPFPTCRTTFTRDADIKRHYNKQHKPPCLPKIFRETSEKERQWCMGCLTILSRSDSRRRHEVTCPGFAQYMDSGYRRDPTILPLPEIYGETIPEYRLWCLKCFATFSNPDTRHIHEEECRVPLQPMSDVIGPQ
ncbi:hypothetical protein C8R43DRAFT_657843 [Mycena crocata]|nr:hypothetical protein C8R43DRAFT_657843 [Mycena crocata]